VLLLSSCPAGQGLGRVVAIQVQFLRFSLQNLFHGLFPGTVVITCCQHGCIAIGQSTDSKWPSAAQKSWWNRAPVSALPMTRSSQKPPGRRLPD